MPFSIIQGDITKLDVDAIVNAANNSLLGGGGVDGAIHAAAGPELLKECRALNGCATGEAKITKGYRLKARHVIHTVGPIWEGGGHGEEGLLRSAYRRSLEVARDHQLRSVAFPLISSGVYGYPKDQALQVALDEIRTFLETEEMAVTLVIYRRSTFELPQDLQKELERYLDEALVDEEALFSEPLKPPSRDIQAERRQHKTKEPAEHRMYMPQMLVRQMEQSDLEELLDQVEDPFSVKLLHFIDEKDLSDVEVYKKANLDRKLFSKIRSNRLYKPSKATALALAIALQLNLEETDELLLSAGYALSSSSRFDVIISWFILKGQYDIYQINTALFRFDEPTLGA